MAGRARVRDNAGVSDSESFHIEMDSHDDDTVTVVLDGEMDMADADWVEATLATAAEHHRLMNIDLSGLSFIDSTGLRALLSIQQGAKIRGIELRFTHPSSAVSRVLEAASFTGLFPEPRSGPPGSP